jgi:RNA-binding protein YhbY
MVSDAGVTPPVLNEIERSLAAHELIKIRVSVDAREERDAMLHSICEELSAASVQHLGKMLVLYRPRPPDEGGPKKAPRPRRRPPRRTKRSYQR